MKSVIIGGTFNPIHNGHLYLAEEARKQLEYERIIFVPTHTPAHKKPDTSIQAEERLEMIRRAVENTDIVIDESEIRRGGVSYMIETIEGFEERYEHEGNFGLVVGDDLVEGLSKWKKWKSLERKIDLILAHRKYEERVYCPYPHRYLENLILPISSRDIRSRVRLNKAYRYLVPEPVYQYIEEKGLYRGS